MQFLNEIYRQQQTATPGNDIARYQNHAFENEVLKFKAELSTNKKCFKILKEAVTQLTQKMQQMKNKTRKEQKKYTSHAKKLN